VIMNIKIDSAMALEQVSTLAKLIIKYQDDIPKELKGCIEKLMDCEHVEINHDTWIKDFGGKFTCEPYFDDVESINPILKTIKFAAKNKDGTLKVIDDCVVLGVKKLESFKAFSDGKLVVQW
jgi:hypothetical protein